MKTAEEFRQSAIKNNITQWSLHDCGICGYECGYMFFANDDYEVLYDSGCNCTRKNIISPTTWNDVSIQYNINIENPRIKAKYDAIWKFEPLIPLDEETYNLGLKHAQWQITKAMLALSSELGLIMTYFDVHKLLKFIHDEIEKEIK